MTAIELIAAVEAHGGYIRVDGPDLVIKPRSVVTLLRAQLIEKKAAIIDLLHKREVVQDDRLRESFAQWLNSQIRLDARGVALHRPVRWSAGVSALHRDHCGWMLEHDQRVPPTRAEFVAMLQELSCDVQVCHGESLVLHVVLREDLTDIESRRGQPLPEPPDNVTLKCASPVWQTAPLEPASIPWPPRMPPGILLVQWEPKAAPVRLSQCSIVVGVEKFICATLRQLDACLQGKKWLAGNWGLQGLIDRLAACGCEVEIVHDNQQPNKKENNHGYR